MSFTQYVAHLEITPGLAYAPFWSAFIQVLRSTMNHETRGQSTPPSIRVSTFVTGDRFTVDVEDDGSGADWHAVRNACETLGGSVEIAPLKDATTRLSFSFPTHATAHQRQTAVPRRIGKRRTSAA